MRIGVFVCHCGTNIAGTVNISEVVEATKKMSGVVYAEDNKYTCSDPGQASIREAISEHQLDRVVVASCSPLMHEPTFSRTVEAAGLNPYLLEMANIREHCSWVHRDKEAATRKAIDLIRMSVAKVGRNEELFLEEIGIAKRALVIGGGIAGMQAALDIGNAGYEVVLVEREPTIGGRMAQLDKTFPTLDCSACILTPKMVDVSRHPNITLLTYSEVESIEGFIGNFKVKIRKKARYVDENKCTGCGVCEMKCPWKVDSEFELGLAKRKAIYIPFAQAVPNVATIDKENCVYFLKGRCRACERFCEARAIDFGQTDKVIELEVGAIIMATGYYTPDPAAYDVYGGGKYPDVISGLQLERLMSSFGPTGGEIVRPSDGTHPKKVVFIGCVGSRDEKTGNGYCSRVCCMYMAKHAIMLKEHDPEVQSYIFYPTVRGPGGKMFEDFLERAQEEAGAVYLRGEITEVYQANKKVIVCGKDLERDEEVKITADLVVLAVGMTPSIGVQDLARTLNISYDDRNFILEAHPKLRPIETRTDGVFLAGTCLAPFDIPESVAQGGAAASYVVSLFGHDTLKVGGAIAQVDRDECRACLTCTRVCPYKVPYIDAEGKAVIEVARCRGCGICAAECPQRAIQLLHYKEEQVVAKSEALLVGV